MIPLIAQVEPAAERVNDLVEVSQVPATSRSCHRKPICLAQSPGA